jgi:hypothetical protein
MAWTLNSVALSVYGITAGQAPGGNIALQGCFDLPERIGDTHHVWDDDSTVEPYVAADEIFFAGRDIKFYGTIIGTNAAVYTYLDAFKAAINAFTTLVTFSTPYGDFSVQVKDIKTKKYNGALSLEITFREPVVTLAGGSLPVAGANAYSIDGIPMSSFGLYVTKPDELLNLPEIKEQYFTKYGAEGYQTVKRKANTLEIDGFIMATSLSDFQDKIKALYLLFKSANLRVVKLNNELHANCFAAEGFNISNVCLMSGIMIARFQISLLCKNVSQVFSDWFLPSKDELAKMYLLKAAGLGGFVEDNYWSSTEASATGVGKILFSSGQYGPANKVSDDINVRACRSFTDVAGAYAVGDIGPAGGYISDVVGDTTYYEAAPYDQSSGIAWSNIVDVAIGNTSTAVGEGQNNTNEIIAQGGHTSSAAKLCNDLIV